MTAAEHVARRAGKPSKGLLVAPSVAWHVALAEQQEQREQQGERSKIVRLASVELWRAHAEAVLRTQTAVFEGVSAETSKSEQAWVKTVAQQGTVSDKIAAMTLMFQEGPVYRLGALQNLLTMAQKKNKREVMQSVQAIKALALADVLPDRKLRYFYEHDDWAEGVSNQTALLRLFEDGLKRLYLEFVKVLEAMTHDTVVKTRRVALAHVFDLLVGKPEQEKNLLAILVDKLGDLDRSIAAKASHLLSQLLLRHPNMKGVVVRAVEALLFRPKVSMRARYYALIMLNQLILTKNDTATANHLIDVYFALYIQIVSSSDLDTRILSALLTGVNRAFPFSKIEDDIFAKHLDTLYRVVHVASFNTGVQALMLIFHVISSRQAAADRFYRALYDVLFDRRLFTSSKQPLFLNLLYKAIKADSNLARVKAFIKRTMQVALYQQPSFICAVLILVSEMVRLKSFLWPAVLEPQPAAGAPAEDDVERFVDKDEHDKAVVVLRESNGAAAEQPDAAQQYDPRKRDPKFCNADTACFWELTELAQHFHPSVAKFAQTLLRGELIEYKGDPLGDFTLANFLERFVYKNPKKDATGIPARGSSIMQPVRHVRPHTDTVPVFDGAFVRKAPEEVPPDQLFYYNYFKEKQRQEAAKEKQTVKRRARSEQDEDALEGLTDEQIDEALGLSSEVMDEDEDDDHDLPALDEGDLVDDEDEDEDEGDGDADEGKAHARRPAAILPSKDVDEIDLDDDEAGYEGLEAALEAVDAEDAAMVSTSRRLALEGDEDEDEDEDEGADDAPEEDDVAAEEGEAAAGEDEVDSEDDDAFARAMAADEDNEDDEDDEDDDEVEDEDDAAPLSKRQTKKLQRQSARESVLKGIHLDGSTFASADDFAHLIEESAGPGESRKQRQWEDRGRYGAKRQQRGQGGRGGAMSKRTRRR